MITRFTWINELPRNAQAAIADMLAENGITDNDDIERALNSRIGDLEDTIDINVIVSCVLANICKPVNVTYDDCPNIYTVLTDGYFWNGAPNVYARRETCERIYGYLMAHDLNGGYITRYNPETDSFTNYEPDETEYDCMEALCAFVVGDVHYYDITILMATIC